MSQASEEYYLDLPYDLAGSRSKNRFRAELLWGVGKMIDLMEEPRDFTMVFDYVCDIEIHYDDGFEFYQIKTHKGNSQPKTFKTKDLVRKHKEKSIIGKLYVLNDDGMKIKMAVVCNLPHENFGDTETGCFSDLPEAGKDQVIAALRKELNVEEVDLSRIFYVHTEMNLVNPENEIRGKLVFSFEKIKGCEPNNPNALYRLVMDTVKERACYEFSADDYSEILRLKGISRKEFDEILNLHAANARTGIAQAKQYIDSLTNVKKKREYNTALPKVLGYISTSKVFKEFEKTLAAYLYSSDEYDDTSSALNLLLRKFECVFPTTCRGAERDILCLIVIKRFEEGAYDDANDIP